MLNETLAFDSADEKIWTGTETRPKEIVAVPMLRAGMGETGKCHPEGAGRPRDLLVWKSRSLAALRMTERGI
jgi:hypothetical protein